MPKESYDVVVIGGGHAGCEAAYAAARLGAATLMLTINLDHIAQMSCNPCIGGIAKGHVVREIDALGGAMGEVADAAAIQFRMLNRGKGPAVWSPRAQCDKITYQRAMKGLLERTENLIIRQAEAISFLLSGDAVCGVETEFGDRYLAKSIVVCTGTFLAGLLHYGLRHFPGGRAGDPAASLLASAYREQLKLHVGRLKTGTPPRLLGSTIDFSGLDVQPTEEGDEHFSFFSCRTVRPRAKNRKMVCYLSHTGARAAELVRANLDKAPMYNGAIHGIGIRYCPSFEDKIVRFPRHERHHVYLEPEGEYTDEYYVNGLSTSLPPEIQLAILHTVPGLEHAKVTRYAYAIEYDFVFPGEISRTMAVKKWRGLYHAGQINGTSGYEEAAGQGLLAGLNAARYAAGKNGIELGRDSSYIGVLADDIATKEIVEPYRLFTSRAEHRLTLRQDNADFRLCPSAHDWGLLPDRKYRKFLAHREQCGKAEALARSVRQSGRSLWEMLKECGGDSDACAPPFDPALLGLDMQDAAGRRALRHLAIQAHYEGYLRQEEQTIRRLHALEAWKIPSGFDYAALPGLSNESRAKLQQVRPGTLAQAGRIDGVTPPEIVLLQVFLMRARHAREKAECAP